MVDNATETKLFGIPLVELPTYRVKPPIGDKPTEKYEGLNVELLDEILSFIKAHPQTWEQADWFRVIDRETGDATYRAEINTYEEKNSCGTSFCFAGHVALREGFPMPPVTNSVTWRRDVEGERYPEEVDEFARKRLGLNWHQADALFAGENKIEHIEFFIALLKDNPEIHGDDLELARDYVDNNENRTVEGFKEYKEEEESRSREYSW